MPQVLQSSPVVEFVNSAAHAVYKVAKATVEAVLSFFEQVSLAQSRADQVEQMNSLTDRELADLFQINRDQIIPYVFRDKIL
jgi:hypothetical protein